MSYKPTKKPGMKIEPTKPAPAEQCASEIEVLLKKYDCRLTVMFKQETAMGQEVLVYLPSVTENAKSKDKG